MITIDKNLSKLGLKAAAITISNMKNDNMSDAYLDNWNARQKALATKFHGIDVKKLQNIESLHLLYQALGVSFKQGRPSVERMIKSIAKGRMLPNINPAVDIYNLTSLENTVCMGAHDLDTLRLPVKLAVTTGDEYFKPLGRGVEAVRAGEFAYMNSDRRIICRLDSMQADFSKVSNDTKNMILIVEAPSSVSTEQLSKIASITGKEIAKVTAGTCSPVEIAKII